LEFVRRRFRLQVVLLLAADDLDRSGGYDGQLNARASAAVDAVNGPRTRKITWNQNDVVDNDY
jgi:hypothetical protein